MQDVMVAVLDQIRTDNKYMGTWQLQIKIFIIISPDATFINQWWWGQGG